LPNLLVCLQSKVGLSYKVVAETIINVHGYKTFHGNQEHTSALVENIEVEAELALNAMLMYVAFLFGGYQSYRQTRKMYWRSRIVLHIKE
jgi:hypothetical protein